MQCREVFPQGAKCTIIHMLCEEGPFSRWADAELQPGVDLYGEELSAKASQGKQADIFASQT